MLSMYKLRESGRTHEHPAHQRRLDSLGRLLATLSKHTAVCLINKTLYVAALEFNREFSDDNPIMKSFQEILAYFTKVARREKIDESEKKALFETLCTPERLKRDLSWLVEVSVWENLSDELFKKVTHATFKHQDPKISEFKKLYGRNEKVALLLHSKCARIRSDLSKLEHALRSDEDQYAELCHVLKTQSIQFLKNETAKDVHPEMQILSVILQLTCQEKLQKYPTKNKNTFTLYIGSSQLSCMDCDLLMVAVRQQLAITEKVYITTSGSQNVKMKWQCPDGFSKDESAYMPNEEWTDIAQMIYNNKEEYYTNHSPSSTDSEEESKIEDNQLVPEAVSKKVKFN